jgi:hypothetical protein
MRRKLAQLLAATSLALFGGVALAAPASAGPDGPNPHSLHGQCTSAAAGQHLGWTTGQHLGWTTGQHLGWDKQGSTERRNVGGTCGAG